MARPRNLLQSRKLRITITHDLWDELEQLVKTGRFGRNVYDAIERLLPDAVDGAYAKAKNSIENRQAVHSMMKSSKSRRTGRR